MYEHLPENVGILWSARRGGVHPGIIDGRPWAFDNDAFAGGFNERRFYDALERLLPYQEMCLFVAMPDVVGDAVATIERFEQYERPWDYPLAFVAQDGQENLPFPTHCDFTDWADGRESGFDDSEYYAMRSEFLKSQVSFDWLFIGGTTEWKMSPGAIDCIERAHAIGRRVHVGRVNSLRRFRYFQKLGVDSVDGTKPIYAPTMARLYVMRWVLQPLLIRKEHYK